MSTLTVGPPLTLTPPITASGYSSGIPSGAASSTISAAASSSGPYGNSSLSYTSLSTGGYGTGISLSATPVTTFNTSTHGPLSTGTGYPSGTDPSTISQGASSNAPYGNLSTSSVGNAYSTGSLIFTYGNPTPTNSSISGSATSGSSGYDGSISDFPSPSANASSGSYGPTSATPITTANVTYPHFPYPTHGPYPFPTSKSFSPSGTAGTGISQSASSGYNFTSSSPSDPSNGASSYPSRGPYPFPTASSNTRILTLGTGVSTSGGLSGGPSVSANATSFSYPYDTTSASSVPYPSVSPSPSSNASTLSFSYGAAPTSSDPSASPSLSTNASSFSLPYGTGPVSPTPDPSVTPSLSANASSSTPTFVVDPPFTDSFTSVISSTIGYTTGTGDPPSITGSATTFGTAVPPSPSATSQTTDYYWHPRRPHHGKVATHPTTTLVM